MCFTWVHFAAEKPAKDSSNTTPSRVFSSGNEILVAKLRINRPKRHDLKDDLIMAAIRYAELRVRSQQPAAAADPQIDADRTRAHNVFIDACNILGRNMAKVSEDASWRETLGDDRKAIGDLACYIYCFLGLAAR